MEWFPSHSQYDTMICLCYPYQGLGTHNGGLEEQCLPFGVKLHLGKLVIDAGCLSITSLLDG